MKISKNKDQLSKLIESKNVYWESKWGQEDFNPPWSGRGVPKEIIQLKESNSLPNQGSVLDIGCGLGEIASWFAENGYDTLGVDISESAINKAKMLYLKKPSLEFMAIDITDMSKIAHRKFEILVDRGCLHQIPELLVPLYVENVYAISAENAHLILFVRAFRNSRKIRNLFFGDLIEKYFLIRKIRKVFKGKFEILDYSKTNLGKPDDEHSLSEMPGMLFRLIKISHG